MPRIANRPARSRVVPAPAQYPPVFEVHPSRHTLDSWWVGSVDHATGAKAYATFTGPQAEELAREYAAWKNAGTCLGGGFLNRA